MTAVTPIGPRSDARRAFLAALRDAVETLQVQVGDCLEAVEALEGAGPGAQVIQLRPEL
jgi:hypothetical protein